ncbi:MAG: SPOR domain-containing protein [Gammaproteobacteria bacterium]
MAKTTTRLKQRKKRKRGGAGLPLGLPLGLPRGLALAVLLLVGVGLAAWYFRLLPAPRPAATTSGPATKVDGKGAKPGTGKTTLAKPSEEAAQAAESADRFEFYDMLPDAKVDVPVQPRASGQPVPPPVTTPGTYVVQAGAYPNFADADKVKARLALLGVVSEIQTADANGKRFHRVRIGPIENLVELNRLRARLRQNGIEYQVIPVGE